MSTELINELFETLDGRWRPQDVAMLLVKSSDFMALGLNKTEQHTLQDAARYGYNWSSMSKRFVKASNLDDQIEVAKILFKDVAPPTDTHDITSVRRYLDRLNVALRRDGPQDDHRKNRLLHEDRRKIEGFPAHHRAYNKRFRLLNRMEDKYQRWIVNGDIKELAQFAKSRLASQIKREDLSDVRTAAFLAYFTSRSNMRSVFTNGSQARVYDEICEMLFKKLDAERTNWWAIAQVYPSDDVINHLTHEQKGRLLATWFNIMERAAKILTKEVQTSGSTLNLERMIVRRSNDSSTWNEAAGAFNKARDGWINCLHSLGAEALLDGFAPGKALRLMAADVVAWHSFGKGGDGQGLEPDTRVWQLLPKPWDVVLGNANCTRSMIEDACRIAGIEGKGWIVPRLKNVAPWSPAPELVYGVQVGSASLAVVLKKLGFFAGPSKA